jgi:hypothetical protein
MKIKTNAAMTLTAINSMAVLLVFEIRERSSKLH